MPPWTATRLSSSVAGRRVSPRASAWSASTLTLKTRLAKLAYGPFHHRRVLHLCWILGDRIIAKFLNWLIRDFQGNKPPKNGLFPLEIFRFLGGFKFWNPLNG
ncbi:MAG: hypothetical protein MAG451_01064 [Anaerolineales bacterium]|nr:hypothetical protein [Anaerolineales bacterium]